MGKKNGDDRRRDNRPPEEHQIIKGEVRNPDGRNGKAGMSLSEVDSLFLSEADRVVSRDADREVTAAERLVQEEYYCALVERDSRARARILKNLSLLEAKKAKAEREFLDWFYTCKAKYEALFRQAEVFKTPPPDVAHPSHVHFRNKGIVFTGPLDPLSREQWEWIKGAIKIAAFLHKQARDAWKRNPTNENLGELEAIEKHRRWLMRGVPKGWNWREDIYCRHSQTAFVKENIKFLEAHQ